jgi:hypothetical protein
MGQALRIEYNGPVVSSKSNQALIEFKSCENGRVQSRVFTKFSCKLPAAGRLLTGLSTTELVHFDLCPTLSMVWHGIDPYGMYKKNEYMHVMNHLEIETWRHIFAPLPCQAVGERSPYVQRP